MRDQPDRRRGLRPRQRPVDVAELVQADVLEPDLLAARPGAAGARSSCFSRRRRRGRAVGGLGVDADVAEEALEDVGRQARPRAASRTTRYERSPSRREELSDGGDAAREVLDEHALVRRVDVALRQGEARSGSSGSPCPASAGMIGSVPPARVRIGRTPNAVSKASCAILITGESAGTRPGRVEPRAPRPRWSRPPAPPRAAAARPPARPPPASGRARGGP